MNMKETVVIGFLGSTLDRVKESERWLTWRPSVALCQNEDLLVDRFEILYQKKFKGLLDIVMEDIKSVSPETEVIGNMIEFANPWDFEQVYGALLDFALSYKFDTDREDYLVHITTGSHVAQICCFILTESRYFPARLLQTSPSVAREGKNFGAFHIIDLDLSKYDKISQRFLYEQQDKISFLKGGIETRNKRFNQLIEKIERVAVNSKEPILLTGPTGAGKSKLAKRIYELKKNKSLIQERFVEVNCATLRGEGAMSTLFGHKKGAFTGAVSERAGLLMSAHRGMLFLDEIGELGMDEQTMLLRAVEEKRFLPLGSDVEMESDFDLIAGTNRDLGKAVEEGNFREDLLARINLWTFNLPGLRERPEDIEPNFNYELQQFSEKLFKRITINKEARKKYLDFATSPEALWRANFRDLNASVCRMATLSNSGRITTEVVTEEIERLKAGWSYKRDNRVDAVIARVLGPDALEEIDLFDRCQLAGVIDVCNQYHSLSQAGRKLFNVSRERKKHSNDSDRLRKYLAKFNLTINDLLIQ